MKRSFQLAAALITVIAAVAACSSASGNSASSSSASPGASAAGGAVVRAAQARLDRWDKGTDRALPAAAPKPQPGRKVWVIACAMAAEGCAIPADAIKTAGGKIGWHVTVFDGGFDPTTQNNGIRSAIANHANAIVLIAVDCPTVKDNLLKAKAAGIKLYSDFSLDCNEGQSGPQLFNAWATFSPNLKEQYSTYLHDVRAQVGVDWTIVHAGAKAHVLIVDQSDLLNSHIETSAFKELFAADCPSCTVSTAEFTGPDLLNGNLKNIVAAALTKDPSVQVVIAPYDAAITNGIGAAVQQAEQGGRKILLVGYEGLSANMAQIKAGGPDDLSTGFPSQWVGWQTVDELNRLFDNQPLVDEGMGFQAVDKGHNIPTATTFYDGNVNSAGKPRQNYEANFLKVWGVAG